MPVPLALVRALPKVRHLTSEAAAERLGLTMAELREANRFALVAFADRSEPTPREPMAPTPHWSERMSDKNRRYPK